MISTHSTNRKILGYYYAIALGGHAVIARGEPPPAGNASALPARA